MILKEEKLKISRDKIQKNALNFIAKDKYKHICLEYATGVGKSYTMILILNYILSLNKTFKVLLLEPELALIENIKKEFIKFDKENLLQNIDIICYASLKKIDEEKYDVIIADEAHHNFSELRQNALKSQKPKYSILLSATLNKPQIKKMEKIWNCEYIIHKVSLKNAMTWGILPSPKIGVFNLKLKNKEKNCQYIFERGEEDKRKTIEVFKESEKWKYIKDKKNYPNLHLIVNCTEEEKHNQLEYQSNKAEEFYIKKQTKSSKTFYLYSELCIKRFLSDLKTPYLDEFLNDIDNQRYLVFAGSVAQAEELAKNHNGHVISSNEKNSQEIIDKFNSKEYKNLYTCKKIQEGANLSELDCVIMIQLDGNSKDFIQKFGRGLRGTKPEIFIFYFKGTKDEKYLETALMNIDKELIEYFDYFYDKELISNKK